MRVLPFCAEELMQQTVSFPELCFHGRIQQYHGAFPAGFDEYRQQFTPAQFKRDGEHSDLEQPLRAGGQRPRGRRGENPPPTQGGRQSGPGARRGMRKRPVSRGRSCGRLHGGDAAGLLPPALSWGGLQERRGPAAGGKRSRTLLDALINTPKTSIGFFSSCCGSDGLEIRGTEVLAFTVAFQF